MIKRLISTACLILCISVLSAEQPFVYGPDLEPKVIIPENITNIAPLMFHCIPDTENIAFMDSDSNNSHFWDVRIYDTESERLIISEMDIVSEITERDAFYVQDFWFIDTAHLYLEYYISDANIFRKHEEKRIIYNLETHEQKELPWISSDSATKNPANPSVLVFQENKSVFHIYDCLKDEYYRLDTSSFSNTATLVYPAKENGHVLIWYYVGMTANTILEYDYINEQVVRELTIPNNGVLTSFSCDGEYIIFKHSEKGITVFSISHNEIRSCTVTEPDWLFYTWADCSYCSNKVYFTYADKLYEIDLDEWE